MLHGFGIRCSHDQCAYMPTSLCFILNYRTIPWCSESYWVYSWIFPRVEKLYLISFLSHLINDYNIEIACQYDTWLSDYMLRSLYAYD